MSYLSASASVLQKPILDLSMSVKPDCVLEPINVSRKPFSHSRWLAIMIVFLASLEINAVAITVLPDLGGAQITQHQWLVSGNRID